MNGAPADTAAANRDVIKALLVLGAFAVAATTFAYVSAMRFDGPIPRDGSTLVVGRDFLNMWMYGRAAWTPDPGRFYDAAIYQRELQTLLDGGYPGQNWSYPPSVMLVAWPFGLLGYLHALLLWTLFGLTLLTAVARRALDDWRLTAALLISPAALFCVISGQSALITTAMLVGIFATLDRRTPIAGVLIGLLTIKPQVGVFFPILLIASGRWRVFFIAAITAIALAAASITLFGVDPWLAYLTQGIAAQQQVLRDPEGIATPYYPTIYMNLRGIGLEYTAAMALQLLFTAASVAAIAWAFWKRRDADPRLLMALFVAASVAGVPYLLVYDTLPMTFAALALLAAGTLDAKGRILVRFVFWLPLLQIGLGTLHIPGPALIAPAFMLYVVWLLGGLRHAAVMKRR